MNRMDENRDEIRLSWPIIERLAGRFRFSAARSSDDAPCPVDISSTNEQLALGGRSLSDFVAVPPKDLRVIQFEHLPACDSVRIVPSDIVLMLLCGGMSFRSRGEIHPLRGLQDPVTKESKTLLDRQLDRLTRSVLGGCHPVIVATPMNEGPVREHIGCQPPEVRPRICVGGLAPRLLPNQRVDGGPLVAREPSGQISFNPVGHMEALRWLILSGMLSEFADSKVIIFASYSNWGRIFNRTMMDIADFLLRAAQADNHLLFLAEVTERDVEKERGSILVTDDDAGNLRLVKFAYGRGGFRLSAGNRVLMSTNTLYFSTSGLIERLRTAASATGVPDTSEAVLQLLREAATGRERDVLARLFDSAFPVEPHLIPVPADGAPAFLRVERDLDQLTLMREASPMKAVEVPDCRGVFMKVPGDFEDPAKLAFVFDHEA